MSRQASLCSICKRYRRKEAKHRPEQEDWPFFEYCEAYPDGDGIPMQAYMHGHFKPKEGDHGLQYLPSELVLKKGYSLEDIKEMYGDLEDEPYVYEPRSEDVYV